MYFSTLHTFDPVKYKEAGLVYAVHVEAVSAFRGMVADFGALFGNKSELITKKLNDAMIGAYNELESVAKKQYPNAAGVIGIRTQFGDISRDDKMGLLGIVLTGTAIVPKTGGQRKTRKHRVRY
jgi:uncharacterized protein YbjQ (UPF0145 family)